MHDPSSNSGKIESVPSTLLPGDKTLPPVKRKPSPSSKEVDSTITMASGFSLQQSVQDRFSGSISRPGFLELCAGSANLSFTAEQAGFFALPIDYSRNKFIPKVPVIKLDLTEGHTVDICKDLIQTGTVQVVTAAVPCGTCSRAREIYIPGGPKPLRSDDHPYGLPWLSGVDLARVETANVIYANVHEILLFADKYGCISFEENPGNSIFFLLDEPQELLERGWIDVLFQHCKWTIARAMRRKWTRCRTNCEKLLCLAGECKQSHEHLEWGMTSSGGFASAGEAEYPIEMCKAIVDVISEVLVSKGYKLSPQVPLPTLADATQHGKRRAVGGKQPRGNRLPPLIPEFKEVITTTRRNAADISAKIFRPGSSIFLQRGGPDAGAINQISDSISCSLPEGCLQAIIPQEDEKRELGEGESWDDVVLAGVYRTPEEFIAEATKMTHPIDLPGGIPDEILHSIFDMFTLSPMDIAKCRISSAKSVLKLMVENRLEDERALSSLPDSLKTVMKGKHLVTAQRLLEKWNYPDVDLVKDTLEGFKLTGTAPFSKVFDYNPKLPTMSENSLRLRSSLHNKAMISRCKSSGSPDLDKEFWKQTLSERDEGWLTGPFDSEASVKQHLSGQVPHFSRRFPLQQNTKIRSIDDLLESGINTLFGSHDKLVLMDTDTLSSIIRLLERIIKGETKDIVFQNGTIKTVNIHKDWQSQIFKWKGKTKDLSQAYKQLAVNENALWSSCIVVFDPYSNSPKIFVQATLPFGASASVLHFNRWSRFIWFLGIKEMGLIWTCFFDDFPTFSTENLQVSSNAAANAIMKCLGWRVAEGAKDVEWSEVFDALGVRYDLTRIGMGASTVGNKPGRADQVVPILEEFIKEKRGSTKDIEVVKGKLQYMESQVFGRTLKSALSVLNRTRGHGKRFSDQDIKKISWILEWLQHSLPRRISPSFRDLPLLLFTDGACEGFMNSEMATTTCGAVLLDRRDNKALVFGFKVNDSLQLEWKHAGKGKKQLVTEAELLPVLISRKLWMDRVSGSKIITFVDSNPAKFSLIRGTSESESCEDIIRAISILDAAEHVWVWYARVPSKSNPADLPSRLQFPSSIAGFQVEIFEAPQPSSLKDGKWK